MKNGDVIEVLAGTFGWVFGKAFLFALAIAGGLLLAGAAIPASGHLISAIGHSGSTPTPLDLAPRSAVTGIVLVMVMLFAVLFSGMWFVRSEAAGWRMWLALLLAQALAIIVWHGVVWQPGGGSVLLSMGLVAIGGAMLGAALWYAEAWQTSRWAVEMARLQAENAVRRAELKARFGIESASAADLGLE